MIFYPFLESFVFRHVFFHRNQLFLQILLERRQRFANVVGQLLVQNLLQVRSAHSVRHVAVARVRHEKLALILHRRFYVLFAGNVLLASVDDAHESATKRQKSIFEDVFRVSSLIRVANFGKKN